MTVQQKTVNGKTLSQSVTRPSADIRSWARKRLAYDPAVKRAFITGPESLKVTVDGNTRIEPPSGCEIEHVTTTDSLTHIWMGPRE